MIVQMEHALAVGFCAKNDGIEQVSQSLEELKELFSTAGGEIVYTFIQKRRQKDPATLIGAGKVDEIASATDAHHTRTVIFDCELTPAQQKNLQERIPAKVIDRTRLILDIFAKRAHTKEGKLQVELAQLNYLLPRATEKFGRFEQQVGGIGTRGPGERKLEADQRHIRNRITHLKKEMGHVRKHRTLQRMNRERVPFPIVALIGYTNVGKSTLLNTIHASEHATPVYADNKLFATLDPTARRVKLPHGRQALFVDTVGFVQKLPHHLVAAFQATLEEVRMADLLVHVVDAANSQWMHQYKVVLEVLQSLKADHVCQVVVFNKGDLLSSSQKALFNREERFVVSALKTQGINDFLLKVESLLEKPLLEKKFILPHDRQDLLPVLYKSVRILSEKQMSNGTRLHVLIAPQNWGHIEKQLKLP